MQLEFDCRGPVAKVNVDQRCRLPTHHFKIVVQLYKEQARVSLWSRAVWSVANWTVTAWSYQMIVFPYALTKCLSRGEGESVDINEQQKHPKQNQNKYQIPKHHILLTYDRICGPSRATCHTAVAQLDTSYPAVHPDMAIAQFLLPILKQIVEPTGLLIPTWNYSLQCAVWHKLPIPYVFPDVRNCALGPPQNPTRDSDLALNPHCRGSSQPGSLSKERNGILSKKEEKEGYVVTPFQTEGKKALIVVSLEVPAHRPTQRGISTHCLKKEAQLRKSSLPQTHTPRSPPLP